MQETDRYDLALTLGGGEVRLIELTNAYATFAREGIWKPYHLITRIESDQGDVLYTADVPEEKEVLSQQIAWLITDILSDPKARIPTFGEKSPLLLSVPAAVKTGTTTDWHDNWTIGYTRDYTVGVWVGNADNHPMRDITGVTGAAPIWNQVMEEIMRFIPQRSFNRPDGIVDKEICAWDGLLPTPECTERFYEKYVSGTEPTGYSTLTQKPTGYSNAETIQIITPREGSVYETGFEESEVLVFDVTPLPHIHAVSWSLDGLVLGAQTCHDEITCKWPVQKGNHTISAIVHFDDTTQIALGPVNFSILEYKKDW